MHRRNPPPMDVVMNDWLGLSWKKLLMLKPTLSCPHNGSRGENMSRFMKLTYVLWHCQYHLVWIPKYRYRILKGEISSEVHSCVQLFCGQLGCLVAELNAQVDHVHLLVKRLGFAGKQGATTYWPAFSEGWPSVPPLLGGLRQFRVLRARIYISDLTRCKPDLDFVRRSFGSLFKSFAVLCTPQPW